MISWNSFKLIIENKIWSDEGDQQIARYLQSSEMAGPGCIVYLTPDGRRPQSIASFDDARVTAISYSDLAGMIQNGLRSSAETKARGLVFAEEFRNCILRLLKVRDEKMTKPQISESTKIYVGQAKRLAEIKSHAIDEFADFLQWMYSEVERRLQRLVGSEIVTHRGKYVVIFRLPKWKRDDVGFGFYFGMDHDPTKTLISEPKSGPWAGVGAWRVDDSVDQIGCKALVDLLSPRLMKVWPHKEDLRAPDYSMALWREVRIREDGDINAWAEEVVKLFEELASTLTPTLEQVAAGFAAQY